MKKLFFILPIIGMLCACNKQNELPASPTAAFKNSKLTPLYARDGHYDLLGFGYDVTGDYGNSSASLGQVINVALLDVNNAGRVIPGLAKSQYFQEIDGSNAATYSSMLSGTFNSGLTLPLFGATIKSSYTSNDSYALKYIYGSYNVMIQQKEWALNANLALLQQYLSPAFLADIQDPNTTPDYIVSHYGTHVLSHIILGGKLNIMYQSQTSSSDRKTAAQAGLQVSVQKVFNLDAGFNYNEENTTANYSENLSYVTHGGDPTYGLVSTIPFGQGTPSINFSTWQGSCTEQNAELIDIPADGLINIYDLIPSTYATLKAGVQTYVTNYLATHQVVVIAPEGQFIRNDDNGSVYSVMDGKLRYIPNQDVLHGLFNFNDGLMQHYNTASLIGVPVGTTISPVTDLINDPNTGRVYFRENNLIRWITSPSRMDLYHFNWNTIHNASISGFTVGPNM
jgi:hypothetical protein